MVKILLYIMIIFLFISCKRNKQTEKIEFKYSAYSFHLNQEKWEMEFYLAWHLGVDDQGNYKIVKHDSFMDTPKYFKGRFDEIKQDIDSLIASIDRSQPIVIQDTPLLVYDGFTYCLDYKIGEIYRTPIQYINSEQRCPKNLLSLTRKLDAIIMSTHGKENAIDSFSLGSYIDTLKRVSSFYDVMPSIMTPPPPLPPLPNQIKFVPHKRKIK